MTARALPMGAGLAGKAVAVLQAALISAVAGSGAGPQPVGGEEISVAPGTVVRWPGDGIERCAQGPRSWQPLDEECWFAIDLLAPEGRLVVARWRGGRREEVGLRVTSYPYEVQRITLQDDSQVNLSAEDLRRVETENRRIAALWSLDTLRRFSLPLTPPLQPLPPAGRFGARRFFNDQPRSPHSGADYRAAAGTPVLAAADGIVALTGDFFFSGRSVFIDHGGGLVSMYFHLSEVEVEQGHPVDRGQILGRVGQTGRATGPHLHFGIRWRRARVDPALLFNPPESVPALP